MAFTPSIAILVLLVIASSIEAAPKQDRGVVVHEGQCPSNNFPIHIQCRRRVCLPEELNNPLCKGDGSCATTHKCCRPMCSCREQCVEAVPELAALQE